MSVLIKGMEMPKACIFCECSESANYWCRAAKRDLGADPYNSVADFCPLVELPPHGRLIDADALDESLGIEDQDVYVRWTLESAPTIIEAEESEESK